MKHLKLYEQFDFEDLSDEELFGKKTEPDIGDKILILPNLKDYIYEYNWSEKMLDFIGKEFSITKIVLKNDYISLYNQNRYYIRDGWFIFRDCFELI